jgi:hypothetical protein
MSPIHSTVAIRAVVINFPERAVGETPHEIVELVTAAAVASPAGRVSRGVPRACRADHGRSVWVRSRRVRGVASDPDDDECGQEHSVGGECEPGCHHGVSVLGDDVAGVAVAGHGRPRRAG